MKLEKTGFFRMTQILTQSPHRRIEEVFRTDANGRPVFSH